MPRRSVPKRHRWKSIRNCAKKSSKTVSRAKWTEPYAYLIKPFDAEELQSAVEIAIYRHQMERKVRESEQWLFTTLKSIGDGVIATDWEGNVKFMNLMAEKMTGWPQSEAVGKPPPEVFHIINEYTREIVEDIAAKVIATGQIVGLANHTLLVRRDGTEIPVKDSGAPIMLQNGDSIGVVLVLQDNSKSRAAEKRLREDRERLYMAMESANEGLWEWDTVEDEMMFDALCFKMLGYDSRIADGDHRQWWQERIDINALTKEAIKLMRATIPTFIAIHDKFTSGSLYIKANPSQIHQVIVNFCTNAFHAMEEDGGTMRVELDEVCFGAHVNLPFADICPGRYACVGVVDSGHGIDSEYIDRIFDPCSGFCNIGVHY